jgi:KUP system potassium uptake protein
VLHQRVVFLTLITRDIPRVPPEERLDMKRLDEDFFQIVAAYGFVEDPDVPELLELCRAEGVAFDLMETSFFVSRETLIARGASGMAGWRERLFVSMSKNATSASDFFRIPTNRVVEVGTQIEI